MNRMTIGTNNRMRYIMATLRHHFISLILVGIVTLGSLGLLSLMFDDDTASCTISMNYVGIEEGKNPNGSRFTMDMIVSDEVLNKTLEYMGRSKAMSPSKLRNYISMSTQTASTSAGQYYYSSSYNVSYTQSMKMANETGLRAEDILRLLLKAYKDVYYENYTPNHNIIYNEIIDTTTLDYAEKSAYFTMKAEQLNNFLIIRMNESDSFASSTGESFKSLQQRVYNIINYSIANYDAYVWENGIVEDYDQYTDMLNYQNTLYGIEYDKAYLSYTVRKSIIDEYDSVMSGVVLIPSYDSNGSFYMSRTKTGVDYLASEANTKLADAKKIQLDIQTNKSKIGKLRRVVAAAKKEQADAMQASISADINELITLIAHTDDEYIDAYTGKYFYLQYRSQSVMNRVNRSMALLGAVAVLGILFMFYYRFELNEDREKSGY